MPGVDLFSGFVQDLFWTCDLPLPWPKDQVLAHNYPHDREVVDLAEQRSVEPPELLQGRFALRELGLKTDDVPWPDDVVIRLGIALPMAIDEPDPLPLMDLPQSPPQLPPQVLLVGYPLRPTPPESGLPRPRVVRCQFRPYQPLDRSAGA